MKNQKDIYARVLAKANEIEFELKQLGRWDQVPLSEEKFENMGAFGSNTMTFEQWLQFILIERIKETVAEKGDFPDSSMVSTYGVRVFDADSEAGHLQSILCDLDDLINGASEGNECEEQSLEMTEGNSETIELGSNSIPEVVFTLAEILHQFEGEEMESQLQTFDVFLGILSPNVRPEFSKLFRQAAERTNNSASRQRLEKATADVDNGKRITTP